MRSSKCIEVRNISFPIRVSLEPSVSDFLFFLAVMAEEETWRSTQISSLVLARLEVPEGYVTPECVLATFTGLAGWSPDSPVSRIGHEMRDCELSEMPGVSLYTAHVVVIRNDEGENQDSLPELLRRAARFTRDNALDFDRVESVRYVYGFDDELRPYPELHLTVMGSELGAKL
ncbi:hypothetical protein [Populibacterium corticicola]|uniref:hypothetical protein n=1 Tax=Populibacterium corticicola TaxID=1812826 RepID=UPI00366E5AD9